MFKGQKRKLTKDLLLRTAISVGYISAGQEIEIQQVDERYKNVLVSNVWINKGVVEDSSVEVTND